MLLRSLPLQPRLNVVLHRIIHKLILGLGLDHPGTLRAHHLNRPMNVDLAVESFAVDLVENHVYHNERSRSADAG